MGPYERFIALSRYARWLPSENRRETWEETVKRYTDWIGYPEFYDPIVNLEVMPSMRAMMTAGPAADRDNTCTYNCSFIAVDDPKAFDEAMFILLCGTGVGFSVERQYIQKLPEVPDKLFDSETTIVVMDSKEGWAKSFRQLLAMLWAGEIPKWDVSRVRPAGSPLKTFGGRASGPEPLEDLFRFTITTFRKAAGRKLTSIECHDIMCKVGEIVVVGGVRRSALISLSNLSDDRMRHAKSGQWWIEHGHRALANNSVAYSDKPDIESFMREWLALMESKSGERGIYNREAAVKQAGKNGRRDTNHEFGTNPCCFIGSQRLLTEDGYRTFSELSVMESVRTVSSDGSVSDGKVWSSGDKEVIKLYFSDGTEITCTPDHEFQLSSGDVCEAASLLGKSVKGYEKDSSVVYKIEPAGIQKVFDFTEPSNHWGVVDGFVAHNSEIILRPNQTCNLSEAIIRQDDTKEDIERKVRIAAALGTIQSQFTKFPYLRRIWKKNTEEERLLGVSLTGIMDNEITAYPEPEFLEHLRDAAVDENQKWAIRLGVEPSTAVTCIKPSGTVSQLVDSASGIHPRHSEYYIRTVRGDNSDPLTRLMVDQGVPSEPCVMKPDTTTVFSFAKKSPEGSVTRNDMGAIDQLERWLVYQRHWCEHKPSVTITVKDDEWLEVGAWVYKHFDEVSGISFLPHSDHSYKQAPYQEITKEEYESFPDVPDIDWSRLSEYETRDQTKGSQELACSAGVCEIVDLT